MSGTNNALKDLATSLVPYLAGTDATAIHVDVADEITQIAAKAEPLIDDVMVIEDTADGAEKKSITIGTLAKVPGQVSALTAATILITDSVAFEDASDSDAMKKATVQEVFAAPGWVVGLTGATPVAADAISFEDSDGSIKKTTFGAVPIAQAQVSSILLQPAADAAVTILGTTRAIVLTVTAAATVAIADGAGIYPGQVVTIRGAAVSGGGSYTLAVEGGALTVNATGEEPEVMRNEANDAWVVIRLGTATIV